MELSSHSEDKQAIIEQSTKISLYREYVSLPVVS